MLKSLKGLLFMLLIFTLISCAALIPSKSTLCGVGLALCTSLTYICQHGDSTKTNPVSELKVQQFLKATNDSLVKWYRLK